MWRWMSNHIKLSRSLNGCLLAVGAVAIAIGIRFAMAPWLFEKATFLPFFFATTVTSIVGGMRVGMLSIGLAIPAASFFLMHPRQELSISALEIQWSLMPFILMSGGVCFLAGALHKARRRSDENRIKLQAERERFQLATDAMNGIIYEFDFTTGQVERTKGLHEVLGYLPKEIPSTAAWWWEQLHPDDRKVQESQFMAAAGNSVISEYRVKHKDGRWLFVEDRAVIIRDRDGNPVKLVGCTVDVTEQKRVVRELREKEMQLRLAIRAADMIVWRWDIATDIVTRLGETPTDAPMGSQYTFSQAMATIHPDDLPGVLQRVEAGMREDGPELYVSEHRHNDTPDGSWRWILVHGRFQRDDKGRPVTMIGLGIDITATKRVEAETRNREAFIRGVLGSITDAFLALDKDWRFTFVNDEMVRRLDKPREEIVGSNVWELLPEAVGNTAYVQMQRAMSERITVEYEVYHEPWQRWLLDKVFPTDDGGLAVYSRDITSRKRAESLQSRQKSILEMVATNRSLPEVLSAVCRVIEEQEPGVVCTLLMADERGRHTDIAVGSSLPESFVKGLEGLSIDPPYIGSCGETLDRGVEVVVSDVEADARFAPDWRALLLAHGLRSCRSIPVHGSDRTVLASLAVYRSDPGASIPANDQIIRTACHLAGIAIERRRAEEEVLRQATLIQIVNDSTAELIFVKDSLLRLTYANAATLRSVGMTRKQSTGPGEAVSYQDPAEYSVIVANDRRVLETGESVSDEEPFTCADGKKRIFFSTKMPLRDEAGRVVGVIGVSRDITDQKLADERLRKSEQHFRATFEQAAVGFAHVSLEGRWQQVNQRLCDMLGYDREELMERTFQDLTYPDDLNEDVDLVRRVLEGEISTYSNEKRYYRKDGSIIWCNLTVSLVRTLDGKPDYFISVIEDITARKEAEEKLREADLKKDEFLATLAHELRNPLAPIRSSLQLLKLGEGDAEVIAQSRNIMERQVNQMTHLINDLMDLSRISQGKIVLQKAKLNLADAIQDGVDIAHSLIQQRNHNLVVELPSQPIFVDADRTRLAQVFGNLLNNAAKYTEIGGRIELVIEPQKDEVIVSVQDNGVGIPTHLLSSVFNMFSQIDQSLEKSQGGLGIGLNIVKRLVEMHSGSVAAHSNGLGTGSRFEVRFPRAFSMDMESAPNIYKSIIDKPGDCTDEKANEDINKPIDHRRRILVVDDNHDGANILAIVLRKMGNDTRTAYDGFEAIDTAEAFRPDVILMDIGMPKLNGLDACRRIREQPWSNNMIIVAQTGWGQDDDRQKSQDAGFNFHMVKPLNLAALEKLISSKR